MVVAKEIGYPTRGCKERDAALMRRFLRPALIRRFFASLREEGLRMALHKARIYLGMQWRGHAPSVLAGGNTGGGPETSLHGIWAEMARGDGFHVTRSLADGPRIALIGDLNLAQCRKYRIEQLAEFWEAQGVRCDYSHYQDVPRATRILQQATHLCEYRLQASPLTQMYRYEARRLGLPILYDIDDPLFSVSAYETYQNMAMLDPGLKAHFLNEAPKYAAMMEGADLVTLSTPGLVEHASLYTRRPTYLRRNFADQATLENGATAMAARESDDLFRVVFASGSQGHEADFDLIRDQVSAFVTADPNRRLTILGHFQLDHLPEALAAQVEHHPFSQYDQYLARLAGADVALMPLQDDIFNRCKSGVRVIDAASVGLPAIVSSVGDLPNLVRDGETGFVAAAPGDWTAALEALAADPTRRAAMRAATRQDLETRWSAQAADHIISPEVLAWIRT
ncbi:D-inositol-3-phosphate glycosyltransferase [Pelagimonas phthalicica]|uniref:D-inositol-3-phosphate glycosyltransferase n=2 Tax=Pelagimonas phthalicica TaxID=1037362 RepID=A0A238J897_9RHOB|nr:glycosyltransferase involved in cell wall biosynthesis [Pelagimonas phthalicica]SMX26819.1 D-inositol-3-phosphate glycosyltransferase [Pelagimonas phthalicica]